MRRGRVAKQRIAKRRVTGDPVERLKKLEAENAWLRQAVLRRAACDLALDEQILREANLRQHFGE